MAQKWYNLTPEQVEARLATDMKNGLSPKQAAARLRREGKNTVYRVQRPAAITLARDVLRDPCAYMLLASALLAWIFNENVGAPMVIVLTLLNAFFVLAAYIKARSVITDAEEYTIPTATVVRGGKQFLIKQDRLCRGDIIILNKGDVVPCDARLIEAVEFSVIESSLTGETAYKLKGDKIVFGNNLPPERQNDMVFATTVVASGRARAIVCETGSDTYAAALGKAEEKAPHNDRLNVLTSLKKQCTGWSLVMLIMVFVLSLVDFVIGFESRSIFGIFITGLSVATAAMCEYYIIFGYIIIGCGLYGVLRRGKNESTGAVIKKIDDIDKLSGITALVVPKDGAFTTGNIRLKRIYCDSVLLSPSEKHLERTCPHLISAALDSTVYPERDYEKVYNRFKGRDVPREEQLILSLARSSSVFDGPVYMASHILVDRKVKDEVVRSRVAINGRNRLSIRGRVENILPLCTSFRAGEAVKSIKHEKHRIENAVKAITAEGLYALCVATKYTDDIDDTSGFIFEGFLAINEPQLSGAAENIKRVFDAGIRVIMLSDDSTARSYAKSLGIISSDSDIITSLKLRGMSAEMFRDAVCRYNMFEGLNSSQKMTLLTDLQECGETVGYFGSEFEDIGPLGTADVGFSSGVTLTRGNSVVDLGREDSPVYVRSHDRKGNGSEALKQVCDVVVSPADGRRGGFNAVTASIAQARLVYSSLSRMVRYLLTSQCSRLFIFLYSVIMPVTGITVCSGSVFTPVQILTLGLVIDLGVVMALAFRSSGGRFVNREEWYGISKPSVFGLIWGVMAVIFPIILRLIGVEVTDMQLSSMVFYGFILSQMITVLELTSDRSIFRELRRLIPALAVTVAFVLICAFTGMLDSCMLSPLQWLFAILQPMSVMAMYEIYRLVKGKNDDRDKED